MTLRARNWTAFLFLYAVLIAAHFWLLRLPYFWDEAGYYIPAAHDFFLTGTLIPTSTLSNAHPPLPSIYLAIWWKFFGYAPLITRLAMLAVAAFALLQIFLLAKRVANREVAIAATICSAVYPVFFAQSSLAHADVPAMAVTLLGLRLYLEDKRWPAALAFSFAALSKETAIITPLVLLGWEALWLGFSIAGLDIHLHYPDEADRQLGPRPVSPGEIAKLFLPVMPLALWYLYHYLKTGFIFGNPEFVRYNVGSTLNPLRFLLALFQRSWQVFGHMNMWVLTAATGAAMLLPPLIGASTEAERLGDSRRDGGAIRPRIAMATQLIFAILILAHILAYSLIGGALLSRYLLPAFPLVIIIGVSTFWRRVKEWKWLVAFVCVTFVVGWLVNPPYRFAPEDNLNYADYVRLHQHAIRVIERKFSQNRILTAWPATDELRKPYLGYVDKPPVTVVAIENFSLEQITLAQQSPDFDGVLAFSTKSEPRRFLRWQWWEEQNVRFFDYHRDLPPEMIARMLGGTIVMQESSNGQWVAVIDIPRLRNAQRR